MKGASFGQIRQTRRAHSDRGDRYMLETRQLLYLDAIFRHRSFTKASQELFVSQSTLSIAIKNLERELGVKLLIRSSKHIAFTPEGEELMLYSQRILRELREAQERMSDLSDTRERALHIGFSPTLGQNIQSYLYSPDFIRAFPSVSIYLDEGFMSYHIEKIQQETLDFSYNALPSGGDLSMLTLVPTTTAEIFAVMLPTHHLAQFDRIPFSALNGESLALLDEKSLIRTLLLQRLGTAGVIPDIRSSHNQVFSLFNMVRLGNYVGFVNASDAYMMNYLSDCGMVARPLLPSVTFDVGIILQADRHISTTARAVIELIKEMDAPRV